MPMELSGMITPRIVIGHQIPVGSWVRTVTTRGELANGLRNMFAMLTQLTHISRISIFMGILFLVKHGQFH